jgi:aspartyl-tRNA(Asn)/glutamyl-tRNA(Gln) amidotransferase subunit C
MSVTREEVQYIAALAKLKFTDEELDNFTKQFNEILEYMETLNEIDTENVEPLSHPLEGENMLREDQVHPGSTHEEALKNAPDSDSEFFRIPKVIKTDQKK